MHIFTYKSYARFHMCKKSYRFLYLFLPSTFVYYFSATWYFTVCLSACVSSFVHLSSSFNLTFPSNLTFSSLTFGKDLVTLLVLGCVGNKVQQYACILLSCILVVLVLAMLGEASKWNRRSELTSFKELCKFKE